MGEIYFSANHRFLLITDLLAFKRYQPGRKVFVCLSGALSFWLPLPPSARIPPSGEFHIWLNWSYGVSFELISSVLEEGLLGFPWNVISFRLPCYASDGANPLLRYFSISHAQRPLTHLFENLFILLWIVSKHRLAHLMFNALFKQFCFKRMVFIFMKV